MRRRDGFSLIELLIVVAISAALVGVAVPWFQDHLAATRRAKVGQDLDELARGIHRYAQEKRTLLGGSSLAPLVGAVIHELPLDAWGNPYVFDGNLGVVGSLGADARQGGEGEDADLMRQYETYLRVVGARLSAGGIGLIEVGSSIEVQLSKPFRPFTPPYPNVGQEVMVVPSTTSSFPIPLWWLGFRYDPVRSAPAQGRLVLTVQVAPPAGANVPLSTESRVVLGGAAAFLQEDPRPASETGIDDPRPFLWGSEPPLTDDGSWTGSRLRR